jgi:predicted amino acid dehydrogenase
VDAVVACTHADTVCLTPETVEVLRQEGRKLLVIDVAEPSNMKRSQYRKCRETVIRQDAGNAYSPRLKYVLGAASYRLFRLTRGVTFGCFAEAMIIAAELAAGKDSVVLARDWFTVSEEDIEVVEGLFAKYGFGVPSPRCFGEPVESFDLNL